MEKYTEADIAKIISDCEILILPENTSFEDVVTSEINDLFIESQVVTKVESQQGVYEVINQTEIEETEEEFERIYQNSKTNLNHEVAVSFLESFHLETF